MEDKFIFTEATVTSWLNQIEGETRNRDAAIALWNLGPENADMVPLLVARLNDPHSTIHDLVLRFLGCIGPAAHLATPDLIRFVISDDSGLRHSALIALGEIGFVDKETEQILRDVVSSDDEEDRIYGATAILRWLPPEMELLEVLRQSHESERWGVRMWGANLVCDLIPRIPEAIAVAIEFLDDWESETVEDTAQELAKHDPEIVIPLLLPMLKKESHDARFGALWAIREFGQCAAVLRTEIIDALIESKVFYEEKSNVPRCAAYVAQEVGLNCPKVVDALRFMLGDPNDWHAEVAAQTLLSFDEIPSDVRRDAEEALAFMESPPARRGFAPSISQNELEGLSSSELMPDPNVSLRKVRKMPDQN